MRVHVTYTMVSCKKQLSSSWEQIAGSTIAFLPTTSTRPCPKKEHLQDTWVEGFYWTLFCDQLGVYERETKRSKEETDGGKEKANNTDITRDRNMPLRKAKTKKEKRAFRMFNGK